VNARIGRRAPDAVLGPARDVAQPLLADLPLVEGVVDLVDLFVPGVECVLRFAFERLSACERVGSLDLLDQLRATCAQLLGRGELVDHWFVPPCESGATDRRAYRPSHGAGALPNRLGSESQVPTTADWGSK
jgi:hypothetical protein